MTNTPNFCHMFADVEFNEQKPAVKVILQTEFCKEIRIAFKTDQVMREHSAPAPIVIQVLKGEINLTLEKQDYAMPAGAIISLEANVPHSLLARQDSIVRLTLSKTDNSERVKRAAQE